MTRRLIATFLVLAPLLIVSYPAPCLSADPILKPRKYHGPIPQRAYALSIGFIGGPDNEAMFTHLDALVDQPFRNNLNTNDFGAALTIDGTFIMKLHPQFAFRAKSSVSFLTSQSTGLVVPIAAQDPGGLAPLLEFERNFDVTLLSVEGSGLYFFQDASVSEFQTFIGLGLSLFIPYAKYEETTINTANNQPFSKESTNKWSTEPGVHGVLGFLYHFNNSVAVTSEGRFQIAQSKFNAVFPTLADGLQDLNFDVHYTGFVLNVGIARFF